MLDHEPHHSFKEPLHLHPLDDSSDKIASDTEILQYFLQDLSDSNHLTDKNQKIHKEYTAYLRKLTPQELNREFFLLYKDLPNRNFVLFSFPNEEEKRHLNMERSLRLASDKFKLSLEKQRSLQEYNRGTDIFAQKVLEEYRQQYLFGVCCEKPKSDIITNRFYWKLDLDFPFEGGMFCPERVRYIEARAYQQAVSDRENETHNQRIRRLPSVLDFPKKFFHLDPREEELKGWQEAFREKYHASLLSN